MVRKLKYHEQKLLKKVDFIEWKNENNLREAQVIRRYRLKGRDEYYAYNRLALAIRKFAYRISLLPPDDPFRTDMSHCILRKLHSMGVIPRQVSLYQAEQLSVSAFCRRRLPVVMQRLRMAENLKAATELVERGHVRVGTQPVTDPAFLVSRTLEDYVTWVDRSKVKKTVMKYRDQADDYDLM